MLAAPSEIECFIKSSVCHSVDCVLWRHPILLHTKDTITAPLSSMHTETMQPEAIKLFKVSSTADSPDSLTFVTNKSHSARHRAFSCLCPWPSISRASITMWCSPKMRCSIAWICRSCRPK